MLVELLVASVGWALVFALSSVGAIGQVRYELLLPAIVAYLCVAPRILVTRDAEARDLSAVRVAALWAIGLVLCLTIVLLAPNRDVVDLLAIYLGGAMFGIVYGISLARLDGSGLVEAVVVAVVAGVGHLIGVAVALAFLAYPGNAIIQATYAWIGEVAVSLGAGISGAVGGAVAATIARRSRRHFGRRAMTGDHPLLSSLVP